jgi:hypothetical protein
MPQPRHVRRRQSCRHGIFCRSARGVRWLLSTQFLSALADNALLIVTIAVVQKQGKPAWWVPLPKIMS